MGHPRRITKKYSSPKHPWRADRIAEEKEIERKYGLKNKREIWKGHAVLRAGRQQARSLLAQRTPQAEREKTQLIARLVRLGLLNQDSGIDDILALKTEDFLNRRLQTIIFKKGMASTVNQARQFITHGFVTIRGRKVTAPSYIVKVEEEAQIALTREFIIHTKKPKKSETKEIEETTKETTEKKTEKKPPKKEAAPVETKEKTLEHDAKEDVKVTPPIPETVVEEPVKKSPSKTKTDDKKAKSKPKSVVKEKAKTKKTQTKKTAKAKKEAKAESTPSEKELKEKQEVEGGEQNG